MICELVLSLTLFGQCSSLSCYPNKGVVPSTMSSAVGESHIIKNCETVKSEFYAKICLSNGYCTEIPIINNIVPYIKVNQSSNLMAITLDYGRGRYYTSQDRVNGEIYYERKSPQKTMTDSKKEEIAIPEIAPLASVINQQELDDAPPIPTTMPVTDPDPINLNLISPSVPLIEPTPLPVKSTATADPLLGKTVVTINPPQVAKPAVPTEKRIDFKDCNNNLNLESVLQSPLDQNNKLEIEELENPLMEEIDPKLLESWMRPNSPSIDTVPGSF